jgi:hypothetical protein
MYKTLDDDLRKIGVDPARNCNRRAPLEMNYAIANLAGDWADPSSAGHRLTKATEALKFGPLSAFRKISLTGEFRMGIVILPHT